MQLTEGRGGRQTGALAIEETGLYRISDGVRDIPIEQRNSREVTHIAGKSADGAIVEVQLTPDASPARNDAFDVTRARLATGIIAERGGCPATADGLRLLYPHLATE